MKNLTKEQEIKFNIPHSTALSAKYTKRILSTQTMLKTSSLFSQQTDMNIVTRREKGYEKRIKVVEQHEVRAD